MAITNPQAIQFSNEHLRVAATREAKMYYWGKQLSDQWTALGGGDPAFTVLHAELRKWCELLLLTYETDYSLVKRWPVVGSPVISNDSEVIEDGAPQDGRPQVTGQAVTNIVNRAIELGNWMDTGLFSGGGGSGGAHLNTVITGALKVAWTSGDGGNVINRIGELEIELELVANAKLNTLLAVAVIDSSQFGF